MRVRPGRRFAGLALAAAAVAPALIVTGGAPYTVRAELRDAGGLRPNSEVKIGGVPIGTVASLEVSSRNTAIAVLELDGSAAPVGAGARAYVRPANLIGEKFVDLRPGDRTRAAASGTHIPLSRTGTPVELDDLIDTLDSPTRVRLGLLIRESGLALAGRGGDFGRMLRALPPALDATERLVGEFGADTRRLGRLVEQSDRVVAAIARERAGLGALVDEATGALDSIASRRRQLGDTVDEAAPTLSQLRSTLRRLDRTGRSLRPAAGGLRRTAGPLTAALRALPAFADVARPTLASAVAAAPALDRLGRDATPVVARLRPTAASLASFADDSRTLVETLDRGMPDMLAMIEGWAGAIQGRDALAHMFRSQVVMNEALAKTLVDRYVRDPRRARPKRESRGRREAPREGGGPGASTRDPKAPRVPDVPLKRPGLPKLLSVPKLPSTPLPDVPKPPPSGSTEAADDLLDFLLGP